MGDETFYITVFDGDLEPPRIRVRIVSLRGAVKDFSVQLEIPLFGRRQAIVRYDTSHGVAHRDLLDRDGYNVNKRWYPGVPFDAALNYAISDLQTHWKRYADEFRRREGFTS